MGGSKSGGERVRLKAINRRQLILIADNNAELWDGTIGHAIEWATSLSRVHHV